MSSFFLTAGAFITEHSINNNNSTIGIKNVNLFKSPKWTTCIIKIHKVAYKCICADDLHATLPYPIEISKYNNKASLLCDNMIIYQQGKWFEYQLEFTMSEKDTINTKDFYSMTLQNTL